MKHNYQSAWQIFQKSRSVVGRNWKLFGLIYIFPLIGAVIESYDRLRHISGTTSTFSILIRGSLLTPGNHYFGEGDLFVTILVVLTFVSGLAMAVAATRYAQGRKPSLGQVWSELMDKGVRLILLTLLSAIMTLIGFVLFIIPGIFLLGRLYLAQYVLINEDAGVWESIDRSWRMTAGRMWTTYSLILLTLLFALTAVIPIIGPLVSSILALLFGVGPALRYFELKHKTK